MAFNVNNEIDICNLSLDRLGIKSITSFTDNSTQAEMCNRNYATIRDSMLEESYWTFARSEINLAQISNTWLNWIYAYAYPTDCLKIMAIINQNLVPDISFPFSQWPMDKWFPMRAPHDVTVILDAYNNPTGQKAILCNLEQAVLVYIRQVTNPALFPNLFVDALACQLALRMAPRLANIPGVIQSIKQDYEETVAKAKRSSMNDSVDYTNYRSAFERSRF